MKALMCPAAIAPEPSESERPLRRAYRSSDGIGGRIHRNTHRIPGSRRSGHLCCHPRIERGLRLVIGPEDGGDGIKDTRRPDDYRGRSPPSSVFPE